MAHDEVLSVAEGGGEGVMFPILVVEMGRSNERKEEEREWREKIELKK